MGDIRHFPSKNLDPRAMLQKICDEERGITKVLVMAFYEDGETVWLSHIDRETLSVAAVIILDCATKTCNGEEL